MSKDSPSGAASGPSTSNEEKETSTAVRGASQGRLQTATASGLHANSTGIQATAAEGELGDASSRTGTYATKGADVMLGRSL
jgi:hypothetical protein